MCGFVISFLHSMSMRQSCNQIRVGGMPKGALAGFKLTWSVAHRKCLCVSWVALADFDLLVHLVLEMRCDAAVGFVSVVWLALRPIAMEWYVMLMNQTALHAWDRILERPPGADWQCPLPAWSKGLLCLYMLSSAHDTAVLVMVV